MTGWYEPKPSAAPEHPLQDEPARPDPLATLPWMPLDGLMELWAAFGSAASEPEGLHAASVAFAALAEERDAMQTALQQMALRRSPERPADLSVRFVRQHTIITLLSQAATHWFEAASALLEMIEVPLTSEQERLPPELDLPTLLGSTLAQRERVWAIAHSLLLAHVQPYRAPAAFALGSGEAVCVTRTTFTSAATRRVGEEASTITVSMTLTGQGMAYDKHMLRVQAIQALQARVSLSPGAHFSLLGSSVSTSIVSLSPLVVTCRGVWVYRLSEAQLTAFAQQIAGFSPQQAIARLRRSGVIAQAIVPQALPNDPQSIRFRVLVTL